MQLYQRVLTLKPRFGTKTKMAETLGISFRMLDSYLKESSQVHLYPLLPKLLQALPDIDRDWLYFGEGLPNREKVEEELEEVQISEVDFAEIISRQNLIIEQLTETNRQLTEQNHSLVEQLLKKNLKEA